MGQLPDFEALVALADKDPIAFERFRQQTCQQFIETLPNKHQHRLRAVQNRVEMELNRAKTPMAGLLRVSSMMHDSFYRLTIKLEQIDKLAHGELSSIQDPRSAPAEIINLSAWKAAGHPDRQH